MAIATSPEILGIECCCCFRLLAFAFFRADHSNRTGRSTQCLECERAPRLSISEHTSWQREKNLKAAQAQRWENQDEYRGDAARIGRPMHHNDFLGVLKKLAPDLYVTSGNIPGDLALFRVFRKPIEGKNFRYLGYCPTGIMPEYSLYLFDEYRDVAIKEKKRGWRTVLLRLILADMVTEEVCDRVFGPATGQASSVYRRRLYAHRNRLVKT